MTSVVVNHGVTARDISRRGVNRARALICLFFNDSSSGVAVDDPKKTDRCMIKNGPDRQAGKQDHGLVAYYG